MGAPPQSWRSVALIHLSLLTIQIIFSANQIASKVGLRYFHPSVFIFMRTAMVAPFMLLFAKLKDKEIKPKNKRETGLLVAMACFTFVSFEAFVFGMQITSVTTGTTLQATAPLWTLIIALVLKLEGISLMKIIGVGCAIIGAATTVAGSKVLMYFFGFGPEEAPETSKDFPGGLLLLVNALFYSGFVTAQKFVLQTIKPLTSTGWNIFLVAILLSPVAAFFVGSVDFGAVTLEGWLALMYTSIFSMGLAYALLSWVARQTSTTVVAVYSAINPVLSPVFGYFYLGERVNFVQIIGMVVTLTGVFLVIRARYVEEQKQRSLQTSTVGEESRDDVALVDVAGYKEEKGVLFVLGTERDNRVHDGEETETEYELDGAEEKIKIEETEKKNWEEKNSWVIQGREEKGKKTGGYVSVASTVDA